MFTVPDVTCFGEKNQTTDEQGWEDVPPGSALEPRSGTEDAIPRCLQRFVRRLIPHFQISHHRTSIRSSALWTDGLANFR